jgi:hypothetical protein
VTTTTLGDLLARADDLCRELREDPDPVPLHVWESFDATAYLLMRELVGPGRSDIRAIALSHAALSRVLDAYPTPLRSATTLPVGVREVAHLLGRPRSAVIADIRKGQIPSTWDGTQYLVDAANLPGRHEIRPADPSSRDPLPRLSCTLGVAADLVVQDRGRAARYFDAGVHSFDAATAPVLARVLSIVQVAASHAVRVGPLSDVDRPLAVARYSAEALDTLGNLRPDSPMLAMASFAPTPNPVTCNERLESVLHHWVTVARIELNRTVPSTDVIRNVMNQGVHLYAVTARLLEAAERTGELASDTGAAARGSLQIVMEAMSRADRLWGSVTTAMPPTHEYVTAARQLHITLNDTTHDGLHTRNANEISNNLDIRRALCDLQYGAAGLTDMVRDVQHLPDQLLRSGLLFAPATRLTPSVERLHDRAAGRYVSVLPHELLGLAHAVRSASRATDHQGRQFDHGMSQTNHLTTADLGDERTVHVPEL